MSRVSAVVPAQASLSDTQLGQGSWERESRAPGSWAGGADSECEPSVSKPVM